MEPYTSDTSLEAEQIQLELIRRMAPSERATKSLMMTARLIRECKEAIARINPELSEQEVAISFIELNYGKELADAVRRYQLGQTDGE